MAVYIIGGEMGSFVPSDSTVNEGGTTPYYDTAFARTSLYPDSFTGYGETPVVATFTEGWLHCDLSCNSEFGDATARKRLAWVDGSGVECVRLTSTLSTNLFSLEYYDGASWVSVGTVTASVLSRQTIDIHAVVNSASGSLALYIAGTKRIDSGTIDLSGIASLKQVRAYGRTFFSQMVLADEPTVGFRLATVVMTGTGSSSDWVGGFGSVDETVYSDADFIWSDTADEVTTFTGTPVATLTGYTIRAVGIAARAKKGGSGPTQLQLAIRTGGSNYFSSSQALDLGYGAHVNTWETNPFTTLPFTDSDLTTLQYGVKSIA